MKNTAILLYEFEELQYGKHALSSTGMRKACQNPLVPGDRVVHRLKPRKIMVGRGTCHARLQSRPDKGSPDSNIVFKIKQYLRKEHKIPFIRILTECSIRFYTSGYDILGTLKPWQIERTKGLVHTPDIAVTDGTGNILLIVEQDGKIHESADIAARDRNRNYHYAKADIPHIILRSCEIRSSGLCMAKCLDGELEKIGMEKPAGPGLGF